MCYHNSPRFSLLICVYYINVIHVQSLSVYLIYYLLVCYLQPPNRYTFFKESYYTVPLHIHINNV